MKRVTHYRPVGLALLAACGEQRPERWLTREFGRVTCRKCRLSRQHRDAVAAFTL